MTTVFISNLIAAVFIVAGLAAVCRVGFRTAGGWLDSKPAASASTPARDAERLAA